MDFVTFFSGIQRALKQGSEIYLLKIHHPYASQNVITEWNQRRDGWACSTHEGDKKCIQNICRGTWRKYDTL